jgi:hypothetical protein
MKRPQDRVRLRRAILAQLDQRQMTLPELTAELDHFTTANRVRAELYKLIAAGLVCARHTGGPLDAFETWERAIARVKAKSAERGPRGVRRSAIRRGERMA